VAETAAPIHARNGLRVLPDHTFTTCPSPHVLIVPGGFGTRALLKNASVLAWLHNQAASAELVVSVCTGAFLLAQLGLLDDLRALAPAATIDPSSRFHDNGKILTAAGISAGIDCSLHVVSRLLGPAAAASTARYMEYNAYCS
jgi:transcriptional regulator GlxA family with amidase domain